MMSPPAAAGMVTLFSIITPSFDPSDELEEKRREKDR